MSVEHVQILLDTITDAKVIGITGRAGSGKTTLAKSLRLPCYSIDSRFIGDSNYRKNYIESKSNNFTAYMDACNQYNWWNWDAVKIDIQSFRKYGFIRLEGVYDRDTGETEANSTITGTKGSKLIVEGAILGPPEILNMLDLILFVNTEDVVRLRRLLTKDASRRSTTDIITRFLITNYSENIYYNNVLIYCDKPMYCLDSNYEFTSDNLYKLISFNNYIPVKVSI